VTSLLVAPHCSSSNMTLSVPIYYCECTQDTYKFCYMVVVSFIGEETGVAGQNHWSAQNPWQTLSYTVISSTLCLRGIRSHNVNGRHFQQYFSYIVAVSFIGGGNQIMRRKPPTCLKSLANFVT
jgi:hypothetical protein